MPARLAILASGRGSNLQAILDAIAAGRLAERNGQATLDGQALFTPLSLESMAT